MTFPLSVLRHRIEEEIIVGVICTDLVKKFITRMDDEIALRCMMFYEC